MATSIGFDIYAKDRASRAFHEIGRSADGTTGKLRVLGKVGKFAALGLVAGIGTLALVGGKLAKAAAEDQQSAALMAKQFHKSAHATDEQVKATERWITKQGIAKGVADDDLRPALASLVTATHSVSKAQKLTSLAMDISAAKGKSLSSVSTALMKAQNGNVGGLGRLGVATKDAAGKTLAFTEIQKNLAKQFGGAATTKANTLAGKMERLKLIMREAGESIGYKLIPVLTTLATWILNKGIPALDRFGKWFGAKVMPILRDVANFIGSKVVPMFAHLGDQGSKTAGLMGQFGTTVASVWGNVKSVFVSAQSIFQSFWKRYGDLITQYGIGTLKNLLNVVRGVFNIIAGLFKVIAAVMHGDWKGAWQGIQQITRGAVQVVKGLLGQMWNQVKTLFQIGVRTVVAVMKSLPGAILRGLGNLAGLLLQAGSAGMRGLVSGVKAGWRAVDRFFGNVGSKITGALGDVGSLLVGAGKAIIGGLFDGLKKKWEDVASWVSGRAGWIKDHKGPVSKDRVLLTPAGIAMMEGLVNGLKRGMTPLKRVLDAITNRVANVGAKLASLKDMRAGFLSTFSGDSIFGTDLGTGGGIGALIASQTQQLSQAQTLASDVRRLVGMGLSKSLLAQLQASGVGGASQIHALASGDASQIALLNNLNKQTSASLQSAGLTAGNAVLGSNVDTDIANTRRDLVLAQSVERALSKIHLEGTVKIHGEDLVVAIKARNRKHGVKTAGL